MTMEIANILLFYPALWGKYCYNVERINREREREERKLCLNVQNLSCVISSFIFKWFANFNEIAVLKLGKLENIFGL